MKCSRCERGSMVAGEAIDSVEVAGHTFTATLPALRCAACDRAMYAGPDLERFELEVARRLLEAGDPPGAALKFARKALGLRAADFAALLGVAPETVSRWETGERPAPTGAVALLGVMIRDRIAGRDTATDVLRALREPHPLGRSVELGRLASARRLTA